MLNSEEIKNIRFSKSVGGYKQEEVEIFLDKVSVDYERFQRAISEKDAKIAELENEISSMENSKESIQTVLLSAQRLADQIVAEARQKSEEIVAAAQSNIEAITVREKELSGEFDRKASERKARFDEEMSIAVRNAERKLKSIEKATADSVSRQQETFERTKLAVAEFKAEIMKKYKEHLDLLQSIPDAVLPDPETAAIEAAQAQDSQPEENAGFAEEISEDAGINNTDSEEPEIKLSEDKTEE